MMAHITRFCLKATLTIASSGTQSTPWDIDHLAFGSLQMPAALTGVTYAIEGRLTKIGSWFPVRDSDGTVLTLTHVNDAIIRVPDAAFGCLQLRFVSSGAQAAERTLIVLGKG